MSDLIEVKTADLAGEQLAWAVAKAVGLAPQLEAPHYGNGWRVFCDTAFSSPRRYNPHEDWTLGGPLLDEHCKAFGLVQDGTGTSWRAFAYRQNALGIQFQRLAGGPSILTAACRALVTLRMGDTVTIPKELLPCS